MEQDVKEAIRISRYSVQQNVSPVHTHVMLLCDEVERLDKIVGLIGEEMTPEVCRAMAKFWSKLADRRERLITRT